MMGRTFRKFFFFLILTASLFIFLFLSLGLFFSFSENWLGPGTQIANFDLGFKSKKGAKDFLRQKVEDYSIQISSPNFNLSLAGKELGVSFKPEESIENALFLSKGAFLKNIKRIFKSENFPLLSEINGQQFNQKIEEIYQKFNFDPQPNWIIYNKEKSQFITTLPKDGQKISKEELKNNLKEAILNFSSQIFLKPEILSPVLLQGAEETRTAANNLLEEEIILKGRDKVFLPQREERANWISFKVEIKNEKGYLTYFVDGILIGQYLEKIAQEIDDEYSRLNIDLATRQIIKIMESKEFEKELNLPLMAYRLRTPINWQKYIEVNLTRQWLWAIEEGKEVLNSGISSGTWSTPTPTGIFYVQLKMKSKDMRGVIGGKSYLVPKVPNVIYFGEMNKPIEGYALHGTYWHNEFGPTSRGAAGRSHGCINLPLDFAAKLYQWAEIGTPVWIHY